MLYGYKQVSGKVVSMHVKQDRTDNNGKQKKKRRGFRSIQKKNKTCLFVPYDCSCQSMLKRRKSKRLKRRGAGCWFLLLSSV